MHHVKCACDEHAKNYWEFYASYSQEEGEPHQEAPERFHALHEGDASRGASRMYA